jgi:hypothetical protein
VLTEDWVNLDADFLELLEKDDFAGQRLKLSRKITFSTESQATCFFMKNYVVGDSRSFEYLQTFYNSGMQEHLAVSVNAVALATFSYEAQSWELEQKAVRAYAAALHLLNDALRSSDTACNDSTLISVILLDQFEKIMSRRQPRPKKSLTNHINGAASLVRLRGYEQFQSELGLRIFLQISSAVMVSCMQDGTAVPADIIALRSYATNFLDPDDPIWRISQTFIRLVNLYAALKDGTLFEPAAVITAATHIDEECISILTDLAAKMPYQTIYTRDSTLVWAFSLLYEEYYHVYDGYRVAQAWNSVRLGRILLNEVIRKYYTQAFVSSPAAFLSAKHTARFQLATDNIVEMSSQICATVPQFTSGLPAPWPNDQQESEQAAAYPSPLSSISSAPASIQPPTPLTIASAYSLLFPLFVVAFSPTSPDRQRAWILDRMDFIGRTMQIQHAHTCADVLKLREEINVWDIYAMLGSYVYPDRQAG